MGVAQSGFNPVQTAFFATALLKLRDSTDATQSCVACLVRSHSGGQVLCNLLFEMELKFPIQFRFNSLAHEEGAQSQS